MVLVYLKKSKLIYENIQDDTPHSSYCFYMYHTILFYFKFICSSMGKG
ncbi:hypothetical protein T190130A13A_70129 [Tenacibaculum sp. 190130A14a]|uniref:Uncharacterized protein n=1 Tax=Tenacibaculum polynesiense TaxID=3137857 RepID=A0ABP1F6X2_9FLAO